MPSTKEIDASVKGNIGLYFVCYQLSKAGWYVFPTTRNTKGVDLVIYDKSWTKPHTIQVKSLSGRYAVSVGTDPDKLMADYLVVCRSILKDSPEVFIAPTREIKSKGLIEQSTNAKGERSFWIEPGNYERFSRCWDIQTAKVTK